MHDSASADDTSLQGDVACRIARVQKDSQYVEVTTHNFLLQGWYTKSGGRQTREPLDAWCP